LIHLYPWMFVRSSRLQSWPQRERQETFTNITDPLRIVKCQFV